MASQHHSFIILLFHLSITALVLRLVMRTQARSSNANLTPCHAQVNLSGPDWTLTNANGTINLQRVQVPGYALSALQQAGLVGDPLYRFNELETRWVLQDTWTYSQVMQLPDNCLASFTEADLYFDVIDTVADVYLNGHHLAHLSTAHRPHRLPTLGLLHDGNNSLAVVLHPAVAAARKAYEAYPYEIPTNLAPGAFEHYNFIRKPASDFGWDWGPAFAPVGLPGNVSLLLYSVPVLKGVHMQQLSLGPDTAVLLLECEILAPRSGGHGTLEAEIPALGLQVLQPAVLASTGRQFLNMEINVSTSLVELWWPSGYGAQPLYSLQVTFRPNGSDVCGDDATSFNTTASMGWSRNAIPANQTAGGGAADTPRPAADGTQLVCRSCSSVHRRVGFRTVELVTDPLPEAYRDLTGQEVPLHLLANLTGESFYFRVNGVPIFVKGANLIPLRIMRTDVTNEDWCTIIDSALAAHMNMLRVWGGGLYQEDLFYDMCDEVGLLVWQEFMYACAPYPLARGTTDEAKREAAYQVRRLGGHTSIAVWGGNNEIEASFSWFNTTLANPLLYAVDHERLFGQAIGGVLRQLDPCRPYIDTSPSNGFIDRLGEMLPAPPSAAPTKRWGDPQDPRFGDVHFYDYINDALSPNTYPTAKFVSEFGYQSFPSWYAIRPYTQPSDWDPFSALSQSRQRHPNGDAQLVAQMRRHFRVPASWPRAPMAHIVGTGNGTSAGADGHNDANAVPSREYRQWLYLTQVQQALAYDAAFGRWRRGRSDPQALTMGILYWQLNDIWPGYSWSSINYGGRWKLLHYAIRRAYAPLAVSGIVEGGLLKVFLVSDLQEDVRVNLTVRLVTLPSSGNDTQGSRCSVVVASQPGTPARRLASTKVWSAEVQHLLATTPACSGLDQTRCFFILSAVCEGSCGSASGSMATRASLSTGSSAGGVQQPGGVHDISMAPDTVTLPSSSCDLIVTPGAPGVSEAAVWLVPFKDMPLQPPVLRLSAFQYKAPSEVCFNVACEYPALYVALDTEVPGTFSDNALPALLPGHPATICFQVPPGATITLDQLQSSLTVTSLQSQQEPLPTCSQAASLHGTTTNPGPVGLTKDCNAEPGASAMPAADADLTRTSLGNTTATEEGPLLLLGTGGYDDV